jgi:cell surface hyaluronidase
MKNMITMTRNASTIHPYKVTLNKFGVTALILTGLSFVACSSTPAPINPAPITPAPINPGAGNNPSANTAPTQDPIPNPNPGSSPINMAAALRWSDANTWKTLGIAKPTSGSSLSIPKGTTVLLDQTPPALGTLSIDGALTFDRKDLELQARAIMVHGGTLQIGTALKPFEQRARITLTGPDAADETANMGMGAKFIAVMNGGTLDLHGAPRGASWLKLGATANKGTKTITLERAPGWQVGDHLAIASSDYDPKQAEEAVISAISGASVTLETALKTMHYGQLQQFGAQTLDERTEVALLDRNISIRGDDLSTGGYGGHIMIMDSSSAFLGGVELTRMGQQGKLRRYPIHFHMQGDAGQGSYLKDSSIHHAFNRCVTVHGTNKLEIKNNAAFDTIGHCYFLEDGAETGNTFDGNLGFMTRNATTGQALLPSDKDFPGAATFWIENPANTYRNNVAAGSEGVGFWYALPEQPTGPSSPSKVPANANIWPRRTPLLEFSGNVAHSNGNTGLNVDNGPKADLSLDVAYYKPLENPADTNSKSVNANFKNFTAYKNRTRAAWFRGYNHTLSGAILADNAIGVTFASQESGLEDSTVIGETANLGSPQSWEAKGVDGRSLPRPWDDASGNGKTFPIRGFEFYDGTVHVKRSTFHNFQPSSLRQASALSYLRFTAFDLSSKNTAEAVSFTNALPTYLENAPEPDAANASNDLDDNADGYRSSVFVDADGSLAGIPGRSVVVSNPFLIDDTCQRMNGWNASVCSAKYARIQLENLDANPEVIAPVSLTRQDGSRPVHRILGAPRTGANTVFQATTIRGKTISVGLNGMPAHTRLRIGNAEVGAWVRVNIPWTGEFYGYKGYWINDQYNKMKAATSLAVLETGDGTGYWLENGVLSLKLQVQAKDARDWDTVDLCHTVECK